MHKSLIPMTVPMTLATRFDVSLKRQMASNQVTYRLEVKK